MLGQEIFYMNGASEWAQRLGLAMSTLFPAGSSGLPPGEHYAMLNGRRASFACSTVETANIPEKYSQDWQWSADLAHHVLLTAKEVQVRSGRNRLTRNFRRDS